MRHLRLLPFAALASFAPFGHAADGAPADLAGSAAPASESPYVRQFGVKLPGLKADKPQSDWSTSQAWALQADGHLCLSFEGEEPPTATDSRGVRLARCWGKASAQQVGLSGGALTIGAHSYIAPEPIPRHVGQCRDRAYESYLRAYTVRVCLGAPTLASTQVRMDLSDADRSILEITYASTEAPLVAGHPLRVEPEFAERKRAAAWVYERGASRLRVQGTDLCLTGMPEDATPGAPYYLDRCGAPMTAAGSPAKEAGRRQWTVPRAAEETLGPAWRPSRELERRRLEARKDRESASR